MFYAVYHSQTLALRYQGECAEQAMAVLSPETVMIAAPSSDELRDKLVAAGVDLTCCGCQCHCHKDDGLEELEVLMTEGLEAVKETAEKFLDKLGVKKSDVEECWKSFSEAVATDSKKAAHSLGDMLAKAGEYLKTR